MVMGDRIKPGTVHAAGNVKEVPSKAGGGQSPDIDDKTGQVKTDVEPAGDTAGAAAGDILCP
jgi:hypothetical protein